MANNSHPLDLSELESEVLASVRQVAFANQLWFPVVQRHMLELRSQARDQEIHAAIVRLIDRHALVPISPYLPFVWEVANPNETPGTEPSLRKISTSAETEARLQGALSSRAWVDELFSPETGQHIALGSPADVTHLEAHILLAIDHIGWYAHLWFPIVHREALNFGSHAPDDEIHRAFLSLIRKNALAPIHDKPGDMPDWLPAPEAFRTAVYKALGRKI